MEHPIIFSTPMVQAILDGRKTMTRRVVKAPKWSTPDRAGVDFYKYQVGDRLWVRETFGYLHEPDEHEPIFYKADYSNYELNTQILPQWKPSIFMRREHSRITLEITDIRVERLQEITVDDVFKEGIKIPPPYIGIGYDNMPIEHPDIAKHPTDYFAELWDSINGKKYPWSSNPWVWVIEFKKQ